MLCSPPRVRKDSNGPDRAALKSNWAGYAPDNLSEAAAHFGQEGWAGAIPSARLAVRPSPRLTGINLGVRIRARAQKSRISVLRLHPGSVQEGRWEAAGRVG